MMSRGKMSEDMAYVLLDTPLVPRLDLSDCRPTELPVLSKPTTPTQPSDSTFQGSGGRKGAGTGVGAGAGDGVTEGLLGPKPGVFRPMSAGAPNDRVPLLPPAPVPAAVSRAHALHGVKSQVPATEVVRTLVVDMRDLNKITTKHSNVPNSHNHSNSNNNNNHHHHPPHPHPHHPHHPHHHHHYYGQDIVVDDADSSDELLLEEPVPSRAAAKRVGGVLKGGGDYVSNGEQRPRPRVSFLLDAPPGQASDGSSGTTQVRVYAKPPQVPHPISSEEVSCGHQEAAGHYLHQQHPRLGSRQPADGATLPIGLPPKRFRRQGSADRRHSAVSYRKQISQMQAEARLHEAYTAASRSSDGSYRLRPKVYDDYSKTAASQLPSVTSGSQSARRVPLFSFKRTSSVDSALGTQATFSRDDQGRKHVLLSQNGGYRHGKGQLRFHDDSSAGSGGERLSREEYAQLYSRHVEPRQVSASLGTVGAYTIQDAPHLRAPNGKPPLPRHHTVVSADDLDARGHSRVTSASSRAGRVREWLSVDSVPSYRNKPRPSTVSSASSSTRSRDIHSAQHRLASGSSRVSSASLKAASDPGAELENMDPVTLNLMARRCKGPSRYRYLAKLKSLNLTTPRPLV